MKTTTKNTGIKVTTHVKAGGLNNQNHSSIGLKVKSGIKVTTSVKAGGLNNQNHNSIGCEGQEWH